ncbi:hypothetical protein E1B28_003716 [Marasmius oreades]|uniref:Uncharacterized protein n=1 Tax=Marasmius oreades TaxID=181124 RepID=A0A9P8ABM6_9AGAR|nr:uncharacterized protein E1B28_003716 [Marasmius oreades]KAG7096268.1 hypothetical protein E1B28_003716 [Marasmius oreades]
MFNPKGDSSNATTLDRRYSDLVQHRSTAVFTGKLNWFTYAENEMVTLVIPRGVSNGAPVGLYYKWTVNSKGVRKANHAVNSTFHDVTTRANGETVGTFGTSDGHYTYKVTVRSDGDAAELHMSNQTHDEATAELKKSYGF